MGFEILKSEFNGACQKIKGQAHFDDRGSFSEIFVRDELEVLIGSSFSFEQINKSISKKGVIRGIHFSIKPHYQKKLIRCDSGQILDVVVDLRVKSPTFKQYRTFNLSSVNNEMVYLESGMGHAYMALEDNSSVIYATTAKYNQALEYSINPFDTDIGIEWPKHKHILSSRDQKAKSLANYLNLLNNNEY
jgi:dTDP-4-dehydrorhamnose 3,5-epimerase